jgi:hypothetical protein
LIKLATRNIKKKKLRTLKTIFTISNSLKKATQIANVKKTETLIKDFFSFLRDKTAKKKIPVIEKVKSRFRFIIEKTGTTKIVRTVKNNKNPFAKADLFFLPSVENMSSKLVNIDFFILDKTKINYSQNKTEINSP